jgi:hypothetical protein
VLSSIERMVAAVDEQIAALGAGQRDRTTANVRKFDLAYDDRAASAGPAGLTQCQGLSV